MCAGILVAIGHTFLTLSHVKIFSLSLMSLGSKMHYTHKSQISVAVALIFSQGEVGISGDVHVNFGGNWVKR